MSGQTFGGLCRSLGLMRGLNLTDAEVDWILWEETGFPSFFDGDPLTVCTHQINEALDRRGMQ